jgi:phosphate transport system substrate-binding protein
MTSRFLQTLLLFLSLVCALDSQAETLRLSGSNTVGADLGPALAVAWLKSMGYGDMTVDRKIEGANIRARTPDGEPMEVLIEAKGSSSGFRGLLKATADLAMSSRRIKEEEVSALAEFGPMTSLESEFIIALDGIAVIVHRDNPVATLSKAQIRDIFLGTITDWQEVGGSPGAIALHARDGQSGTFDVFRALVLGKKGKLATGTLRYESNEELSDTVSKERNAIGFVGLPYIRDARAVAIADGGAPSISPSDFTVATEDYALSRRLYLYLPRKSASPLAREFAEFTISDVAQDVVKRQGFVSQEVFARAYQPGEHYPADALKLTKGAQRLSVNIRFEPDGISLDNKAKRDLDRVIKMLREKDKVRKGLMVFGFAADDGAPMAMNLERSSRIARHAGRYLMDKGVWVIKSRGYGTVAAVASNDTKLGQEKNRRVEIWFWPGASK